MFWNIYRKYLLRSVRSKEMIIWTLLFPVLLSMLFYVAFSALDKGDILTTIPIAVVEDEAYEQEPYFASMLDALATGEDAVVKVHAVDGQEEADQLLKEDEVQGYITIKDGTPTLAVKGEGMNETVLKNVLDRYIQTKDSITTMIASDPQSAQKLLNQGADAWMGTETSLDDISFSERKPSAILNYYYALIAMTCLYGGFHGVLLIYSLQGNLSPTGARNSISPGTRGTLFGASFLAALTTQFFCMVIVLCFIRFILGISFGGQFLYAVLICLVGSIVGISMGCVVSLPARWKYAMKTVMTVCVSMICSFFAGLMIGGVNYVVEQKAPVLAMINPAARISDAFYCLYYYDSHERFFQNLGILLVIAAVMLTIVFLSIRRKQYESI